jgi:hypothetical protein
MLLHLVCFKYRADVDARARDDHRARLRSLRTLDGVIDLKVGADVVGSSRSYDTGLAITFSGRTELDAYQKNPAHVPVAQLGVSLCEHIVAVDFEH